MQDRTDVPFRSGRHLRVHGVVTGQGAQPWKNRNGCAWQLAGLSAGAKGEAGGSLGGRAQPLLRPTEAPR